MKTVFKLREELEKELAFLQTIFNSLQVIYYINELGHPGDIHSCRTTWLNQQGLDFIGNTQDEITQRGYDFFREVVHPSDLTLLELGLKTIYPIGSKLTSKTVLQIRPRGKQDYSVFYCSKVVMETFEDGSVKKMLVGALEIDDIIYPDLKLVLAMKEIGRLKNGILVDSFTKREKEVLHFIVEGNSAKDIARLLFISFETVKKHRYNLMQKANVKNTAELVALAIKCGAC